MSNSSNIALGVAVVVLLIWRQLRTRPIKSDAPIILNVILLCYGVVAMRSGIKSVTKVHPLAPETTGLLITSFIAAAFFGLLRGASVKVFRGSDGTALRRGTMLTAILWAVSVAAHLGIDYVIDQKNGVGHLGFSTIFLYLAVTLIIQNTVLRRRAATGPDARLALRN